MPDASLSICPPLTSLSASAGAVAPGEPADGGALPKRSRLNGVPVGQRRTSASTAARVSLVSTCCAMK